MTPKKPPKVPADIVNETLRALTDEPIQLDESTDDETAERYKEFFRIQLAALAEKVHKLAVEECAQRLETLGAGRMEYIGAEPENAGEIEALPGMMKVIYGEATAARWLARILRGDSDRGWLPSWRWQ